MSKKVIVLGATGAMGRYLIPKLVERGFLVDAVTIDDVTNDTANVNYIKLNAKDWWALGELLDKNHYDGMVDFMCYQSDYLTPTLPRMLDKVGHYIYLSSCRVYAESAVPTHENSPRLIDVADDVLLLNSDDYCIHKARGENILHALGKNNFTIIRPSITYSLMRYQLVSLEAANTVGRARAGKKVLLPEETRYKYVTMSWAGDVADMISILLCNGKAFGETFNTSSSEAHTWDEIAQYYHDICNLEAVWIPNDDYLKIVSSDLYWPSALYMLKYSRMFDHIMDNTKILDFCGMKQENMMKLYDGLKLEIDRLPKDHVFPVNAKMDQYIIDHNL